MQQGKDLWTSELEASLMSHQIDIVVHSLKDVPTTLGSDFRLSGITERAEPRDALVMKKGLEGTYTTLEDLPDGSVVGTSSVRRVAQLRREFPGLKFMDMVSVLSLSARVDVRRRLLLTSLRSVLETTSEETCTTPPVLSALSLDFD